MANLVIKPASGLKGKVNVPGDKSISHRAVMIGSLAKGETIVNNFLSSVDCLATIECFRKMGIEIEHRAQSTEHLPAGRHGGTRLIIKGKGLYGLTQPETTLDVGNSGTTIRLMSGILAGQEFETTITGDESIRRRPMGRIAIPLWKMGAKVEGERTDDEIHAPLKISGGNLQSIEYELPVPSAQVKSAILLAGLYAEGYTSVLEKTLSRDHTERMLAHFCAEVSSSKLFALLSARIRGGREFEGAEVDVPGDISSAAFFLVAALITSNSELSLLNCGVNPTRTGILDVLHRMGGQVEVENERILSEEPRAEIKVRSSGLKAIKLDGEIIPRIIDEIPIIAVAATQANGVTEISGAKELRIKESDRIATVASELKKLGAKVEELEDGLKITGPTKLKGTVIDSHGDHRIAMAMAIAGLIAQGETTIENSDCIETSFPGFETLLRKVAA